MTTENQATEQPVDWQNNTDQILWGPKPINIPLPITKAQQPPTPTTKNQTQGGWAFND